MKKYAFSSLLSLLSLAAFLTQDQIPAIASSPITRDTSEWWYWCPLPDDYTLVVTYTANRGDITRANSDGTYWMHINANKVMVEIWDASGPVYGGIGKLVTTESCIFDGGSFYWDGRTGQLSVIADLDNLSTEAPESARFFLIGVLHDWTWVQGNLEFAPFGWDMRLHNKPFTWLDE